MRKHRMPIYVVLFLIGATALWYFGHHRPAQKILGAEPIRVYKTTSVQPQNLPGPSTLDATKGSNASDTGVQVETIDTESEDIDITSEDVDTAATSEKIDNSQERSGNSHPDAFVPQGALSPEEAAAWKTYEAAESEYLAAQDILQAALDARPIDWDRIKSANSNFENAAKHRKEALENLAPYSEAAAKLLEEMAEAERLIEEMGVGTVREIEAEIREIDEVLEKLLSK